MTTPGQANNFNLLVVASDCLAPLLDRLVVAGGATTGLLMTDPAAPDSRATRDVDVIVEVQHDGDYQRLALQLKH